MELLELILAPVKRNRRTGLEIELDRVSLVLEVVGFGVVQVDRDLVMPTLGPTRQDVHRRLDQTVSQSWERVALLLGLLFAGRL